jgi:hypothetical protein
MSLTGYAFRKAITIDNTKVDSALTNFPVLVALTSANFNFNHARSDGYDIRFTESDGDTLLSYERDRHDAVNELAEYFVKIPSISDSEDTIIYMYYGDENALDGADPPNVWDDDFEGVYHKSDATTSTVGDSTANSNTGTKKAVNQPIEAAGKINKSQDYDGNDDYVRISRLIENDFTISAWVRTTATGGTADWHDGDGIVDAEVAGQANDFGTALVGNKFGFGIGNPDTTILSTTAINDGSWYHVAATRKRSDGAMLLYVNGSQENSNTGQTGSLTAPSYMRFGCLQTGLNFLNGYIDEVRISSAVRTAAWIKAEYNSGNRSLLSVGAEEYVSTMQYLLGSVSIINKKIIEYLFGDVEMMKGLSKYLLGDLEMVNGRADYLYGSPNVIYGNVGYLYVVPTIVSRIPKPIYGRVYQRLSTVKKEVS